MSFKRDQSNNTFKFGTELCFTNQRNQDRTQNYKNVTGKCGRTNPLQLKHVNIGFFSNNYPGVQPPLRFRPTLVLNLLIKSLLPKTA